MFVYRRRFWGGTQGILRLHFYATIYVKVKFFVHILTEVFRSPGQMVMVAISKEETTTGTLYHKLP